MKQFIAFVKKEFFHIFRDVRTLILLFVMPIILVLLFGFAITTEIKDAEIAILDKAKDRGSKQIIAKILATTYFKLNQTLSSSELLEHAFREGEVKVAVIFPPDFYHDLIKNHRSTVQIITDSSDPNTANTIRNYISAIIRDYQNELNPYNEALYLIEPKVRMLYNPRLESSFYFVPGVITIIITLISAMMTSVTVAREKELGTMEILLVSPLKPGVIIIGKSIPYMLISLINAITVLYLGYAVFEMPLSGSMILLFFECLLFVLTSLSIGLLISALVNTQRLALMISLMGLFLPTMLLSGFIFPIESMPVVLQWVSNIVPAKWFIIIIKGIMLKGVGLEIMWIETLILMLMTALLLFLSIKNFSTRLE